ncbi:DUF4232 domain-containing protein [Brachybacterium sp. AOP29-B2-41]|uniref:DUF4232 domain-containing protein n=1 Tax=Brachybacterium sp. AOP29-B2-41 TaxID=3457704 RepID=UPI004034F51A
MPRPLPPRPAHAVRRTAASHPAAVGILATVLMLTGFAVLLVIGVWASRLGDSPAWAFDCNDTTCTDLWIDARRHYLAVTAAAGIASLIGWFLAGHLVSARPVPAEAGLAERSAPSPVPSPARPSRRHRAARFGRLVGVLLLAAALLTAAGWVAIAASRPLGLAVAGIAAAVAVLGAWRWMRPGAASDRGAYWLASIGVGAPLVALGLFALHPMVFLGSVLVVGTPLLGVPALCTLLATGITVAGRLLPRQAAAEVTAMRSAEQRSSGSEPSPPVPTARRISMPLAITAILTLGVFAAWPVDAPAADAWQYSDPAAGVTPGGDPGSESPMASGSAGDDGPGSGGPAPEKSPNAGIPAAPAVEAAGLPACDPESLQVVAGGWDGWTGNSAATLTATNVGDEACALRGVPELTLEQGAEQIDLRPEPLTHLEAAVQPEGGVGLVPGGTASSGLYWPDYRTAADQETPQTLSIRLDSGGAPLPVELAASDGSDPSPAPFDLKAGVEGGAVIEIGAWELALSSAG